MPSFGKRTEFSRNYFDEFISFFGADKNGESKRRDGGEESRWRVFSRESIAERGDSLDISWIKDDDMVDAADLPEPEALAGEAMSELTEALRELSELMGSLGAEGEVVSQKTLLAQALGLEEEA